MYSKGSLFVYSYYEYSHESVGLMPSADPDSIGVQAQSHFLKSSREWNRPPVDYISPLEVQVRLECAAPVKGPHLVMD